MSLCTCGIMGENTLSWAEHMDICPKVKSIAGARITELEAENARLREALSALYDHQVGPPLPSYEQGWRDAMDLARAALQEGSD